MTLEDYKNSLLNNQYDNSIGKIFGAFIDIIDTIRQAMIEKDIKYFNYFIGYVPDETISEYIESSDISLEKWVEQNRPVIAIIYLDEYRGNMDVESFGTYDIDCSIAIDFLYPHYNINEYINSTNEMLTFLDNFLDMFEMSGRSWMYNNERIIFDRTPMSVDSNTFTIFSNVVCHITTCSVTFKIFKKTVNEQLYM